MRILFLITARGGSKGIPGKNSKKLSGIPLIMHSVNIARCVADDADICVSTDSEEIISILAANNLEVPFKRPDHLATDTAGSYDVILHAIRFYKNKGISYDAIMLMQPTSPFRKPEFIYDMINLFSPDLDMVVSVKECHENPYFSMYEESITGFLEKSKKGNFTRRQDAPKVYAYNGSLYLMNIRSLEEKTMNQFRRVRKYVMDEYYSVDIDTPVDWLLVEVLAKSEFIK
jgi:CMP-N,N'-diacetyllegionaminic acid synthase